VQWKVCTGGPLDCLGNTSLCPRLTARDDVDTWVILVKTIHRCNTIGDTHDSITYRPLFDLPISPAELKEYSDGDDDLSTTVASTRNESYGCITISPSR
jgi:hypothetical protein